MKDGLPGQKRLEFSTDCSMATIVGLLGFGYDLSSPKKGHEPWSVIEQRSAAHTISHLIHDRFDNNRVINHDNINIQSRQHLGSCKNTNTYSHVDIRQMSHGICT
jgi:hypothetical protein